MSDRARIGDYEVTQPRRTAHGTRYDATHTVLPRTATIEVREVKAHAVRLLRQACIVEALQHPAVPRIYECGTTDGKAWVAFQSPTGPTLADTLRHEVLVLDEILDLVEGIAEVLSHAHARGVLHRNITPEAIHLRPLAIDGWDHACATDTELWTPVRGTGRYQAPELARAEGPDRGAADIYALGAIAREALLGDHPAHPLAGRASSLPDELVMLLARMLAVDPQMRPTAEDVLAAIAGIHLDRSPLEPLPLDTQEPEPVVLLEKIRKPRWTPQWGDAPVPSVAVRQPRPRR